MGPEQLPLQVVVDNGVPLWTYVLAALTALCVPLVAAWVNRKRRS